MLDDGKGGEEATGQLWLTTSVERAKEDDPGGDPCQASMDLQTASTHLFDSPRPDEDMRGVVLQTIVERAPDWGAETETELGRMARPAV